MKKVINKKDNNCLFGRKTNCSILKSKECNKCKFFVEDTLENQKKYVDNIKIDIKNYALKHKQ